MSITYTANDVVVGSEASKGRICLFQFFYLLWLAFIGDQMDCEQSVPNLHDKFCFYDSILWEFFEILRNFTFSIITKSFNPKKELSISAPKIISPYIEFAT